MAEAIEEAEELELERRLRELPAHDVGPWRREHVRRRAHRLLAGGQEAMEPRRAPSLWDRFFEPALLAAICLSTLSWAFSQTAALLVGP